MLNCQRLLDPHQKYKEKQLWRFMIAHVLKVDGACLNRRECHSYDSTVMVIIRGEVYAQKFCLSAMRAHRTPRDLSSVNVRFFCVFFFPTDFVCLMLRRLNKVLNEKVDAG